MSIALVSIGRRWHAVAAYGGAGRTCRWFRIESTGVGVFSLRGRGYVAETKGEAESGRACRDEAQRRRIRPDLPVASNAGAGQTREHGNGVEPPLSRISIASLFKVETHLTMTISRVAALRAEHGLRYVDFHLHHPIRT